MKPTREMKSVAIAIACACALTPAAAGQGSTCHLVTFEGFGTGSLAGQIDGTPTIFAGDAWRTLEGNPVIENNPSGDAVAFLFPIDTGEITFAEPVARVSLFYASGVPVTLEAFDANGTIVHTDTGPTNFHAGFNTWDPLVVDAGGNVITFVWVTGTSGGTAIDDLEVCIETTDTDSDGLSDDDELALGTDLNDPDTDNDGLLDGVEVNDSCSDPLDPDTDGDTWSDGFEVLTSLTNPCLDDTDLDGLPDPVDPLPTEPDTSSGVLEDATRALAEYLASLDLARFDAPNDNARAGRRNSLATRLHNAANAIAAGDYQSAIDLLTNVAARVDGQDSPQDWMLPSNEADVVEDAALILIAELLML